MPSGLKPFLCKQLVVQSKIALMRILLSPAAVLGALHDTRGHGPYVDPASRRTEGSCHTHAATPFLPDRRDFGSPCREGGMRPGPGDADAGQEGLGQHREGRVVMPVPPIASLAFVKPRLTLGLLGRALHHQR